MFTERVVGSFKFQLTAYPFADEHRHQQMLTLLSLDSTCTKLDIVHFG